MSGKRQNNQLRLAFREEGRSEAPTSLGGGRETLTAKRVIESPANHEQLMEGVCGRENCLRALERVKSNKGSPGIDGMTVGELSGYLLERWPAIREQILAGTYEPQPVKLVEIPKLDGGVRQLGIPTVLQAMCLGSEQRPGCQTAGSLNGPWEIANSPALSYALPNAYFDALAIPPVVR